MRRHHTPTSSSPMVASIVIVSIAITVILIVVAVALVTILWKIWRRHDDTSVPRRRSWRRATVAITTGTFAAAAVVTASRSSMSFHAENHQRHYNATEQQPVALSYEHCCVLADGQESIRAKLRAIETAQRHILWSVNYVGGRCGSSLAGALRCALDDTERRPDLRVCLVISTKLMSSENERRFARLERDFPDRCTILYTCSYQQHGGGAPASTTIVVDNHAKIMCIDYGRRVIIGGCGMDDNYDTTGLEPPPPHPSTRYEDKPHHRRRRRTKKNHHLPLGAELFLPKSFRDMDWMFWNGSDDDDDTTLLSANTNMALFDAMMTWVYEWSSSSSSSSSSLGGTCTNNTTALPPHTCFTNRQSTAMPIVPVFSFMSHHDGVCGIGSGGRSTFHDTLCGHIDNATESIWIAHMFIHLTPDLVEALCAAMRRGVCVTIISNSCDPPTNVESCSGGGIQDLPPLAHAFYVPRSRGIYRKLAAAACVHHRRSRLLRIFEYSVPKCTYHKKVVVIDGHWVIAGNSNLGDKSLQTQADHEVNFTVDSKQLAVETLDVLRADLERCRRRRIDIVDEDGSRPHWTEKCMDYAHRRVLSRWIG